VGADAVLIGEDADEGSESEALVRRFVEAGKAKRGFE